MSACWLPVGVLNGSVEDVNVLHAQRKLEHNTRSFRQSSLKHIHARFKRYFTFVFLLFFIYLSECGR
jgi:hypothetical protein